MKANELMIGDLVKHYGGAICKVVKIELGKGYACKLVDGAGVNLWDYNNMYEPIPLTEEILKANGWKKCDVGFYRDDVDFSITFHFDKTSVYSLYDSPAFNCKYTHELQHALRLCGLNDLADNFKIQ